MGMVRTSVLPKVPSAWILSMGLDPPVAPFVFVFLVPSGLPMNVNLSQEGSSSESASRSQED